MKHAQERWAELARLHPFLGKLSEEARLRVARNLVWAEAPSGTTLLERGDTVKAIYFLYKGSFRVFQIREDGREYTLYWVEPNQMCVTALNCAFNKSVYPAWVMADGPTGFASLPSSLFLSLLDEEKSLRDFTLSALSKRVFELFDIFSEVVSLDVEQRLAALALRRVDGQGRVHMSQDVIANHLGTAREVVSRVIRAWTRQGFIRTWRGGFDLVSRPALERMLPVEPS